MNLSNSLNGLRKLSLVLKPLNDVCDEIEKIGSLETYRDELRGAIAVSDKELAKKKIDLENATKDLAGILDDIKQRKDAAEFKVKAMFLEAEANIAKMMAEAKARADERVANVERVLVEVAAKRDEARKEAQDLTGRIANLRNEYTMLQSQVNEIKNDIRKKYGL